jgi:membrane protease YdiL (CAAX protease family)
MMQESESKSPKDDGWQPGSSMPQPEDALRLPFETRLLNTILFGGSGLRAGWRVVLFVCGTALFAALAEIAVMLLPGSHGLSAMGATGAGLSAWMLMRGEFVSVVGMVGGFVAVMLVCHQSPRDYFWVDGSGFRRSLGGVIAGFAALSMLLAAMAFLHMAQVSRTGNLTVIGALGQGLLWGCGFVLVALFEEGTFRCFLLRTLTTGLGGVASEARGWWSAAVLSSLIFGGIHWSNHGESVIGISSAAGIGFIFCCTIRWTGSVWWAVGFHAAWDWSQTFFYGTADSGIMPTTHWLTTAIAGPRLWTGGATGPEGSALILPLLVLILLGTFLVFARGRTSAS